TLDELECCITGFIPRSENFANCGRRGCSRPGTRSFTPGDRSRRSSKAETISDATTPRPAAAISTPADSKPPYLHQRRRFNLAGRPGLRRQEKGDHPTAG